MTKKPRTVPNQLYIKLNKNPTDEKGNDYAKIQLAGMAAAAKDLTPGQFQMWVYFAKNAPTWEFALSRQAAFDDFGIGESQYKAAKQALIEKGYLTHVKDNLYIFNETPVSIKTPNEEDVSIKDTNDVSINHPNEENHVGIKSTNETERKSPHQLGENSQRNIINITTEHNNSSENSRTSCENFPHGDGKPSPVATEEVKGMKAKRIWQALPPRTDESVQLLKQFADAGMHCVSSTYTFDNLLDYFTIEQLQQSIATVDYNKRVLIEPDGTAAVIILEDNIFGF